MNFAIWVTCFTATDDIEVGQDKEVSSKGIIFWKKQFFKANIIPIKNEAICSLVFPSHSQKYCFMSDNSYDSVSHCICQHWRTPLLKAQMKCGCYTKKDIPLISFSRFLLLFANSTILPVNISGSVDGVVGGAFWTVAVGKTELLIVHQFDLQKGL